MKRIRLLGFFVCMTAVAATCCAGAPQRRSELDVLSDGVDALLAKSNLNGVSNRFVGGYVKGEPEAHVGFIANDNLTDGLRRSVFLRDAWKVIQWMYGKGLKKPLEVVGYFPTRDAYGNVSLVPYCTVTLTYEAWQRINKEAFFAADLPEVGTVRWW